MSEERHSAGQKQRAVMRELQMRRRVYPRWVEQGRMSPHQAAEEISLMEAILEDYNQLVSKERLL